MNKTLYFLIPTLITAANCLAKDTIVFENGDILSGRILSQNAEQVYFRSEAFGPVSLQTRDIAEIRMEPREQGEVAVPDKALAPEKAEPEKNAAQQPTMPAPQTEKEETKSKWSGQTGLAIAMRESTTSNASGITETDKYETYRFYGNVDWKSDSNKLRWDWTYRYSRDETKKRDDYFNLIQRYTHDFRENYYATAKTMYQRDFRRKIENEYLQTAEIGVKWFKRDKFQFATSAGGGYHRYDRIAYNTDIDADEQLSIGQPKFIFDESLRWQIIDSLALIQKYTHLGDLKDYHLVFSAGLENKLIRELFLRLEYRLDRDTEVHYDDRGYYDKALLTSLLYKF